MDSPRRVLLSWSSGKDSAWSLHALNQDPSVKVVGLLTTFNEAAGRVAMHAVRRTLVAAQAQAVGLPLVQVPLPARCSNARYEQALCVALESASADLAFTHIAFGDLFLEDVRAYRERQMEQLALTPLFPLWGRPTDELAADMIESGLKAYLTCLDPRQLDRCFAGAHFDTDFLNRLPTGVDPCGERGEFHTFAYAGPMFDEPITVKVSETVTRDGFVFTDLKLVS